MLHSLLALSGDQIVVVVIACVAVVALLAVGAILFARSGKSDKKKSAEEPAGEPEEQPAPVSEETEEKHEEPGEQSAPVLAAEAEEPAAEEPAAPVEEQEPAPVEEVEEASGKPAEEPVPVEEASEEPAEEPAPVEEVKEVAAAPAEAQESAPAEAPAAKQAEEPAPAAAPAKPRLVNVKYDKSFTARLIQSSDKTKGWYGELKNELLSYKKVRARMSWKHESFRIGRDLVVRFAVRGRTLCVFFDLDPEAYINYGAEDVADKASHADAPCLLRVRNDRRCRYAKALIAAVMEGKTVAGDKPSVNYYLPYEDDEPLLERGLVKPVKQRAGKEPAPAEEPAGEQLAPVPEKKEHVAVSVKEAEEQMTDEEAKARVEWSDRVTDKSKSVVVNVDTLSEYFEDGEFVGLAEMVARIPYLSPKTTYVKVLARGRINKSLTVEADDFSPDAVKMIVLAGGRVIHTRSVQ